MNLLSPATIESYLVSNSFQMFSWLISRNQCILKVKTRTRTRAAEKSKILAVRRGSIHQSNCSSRVWWFLNRTCVPKA